MQRKPGFPVANCSIKMPEPVPLNSSDLLNCEDDPEQQQKRLKLVNFGHSLWGFNNWSWKVTKQEVDFVDFSNGKYYAGVVAYVSISIKTLDIYRENIGYASSFANNKGFAIYKCRKSAVTNALKETLLSFGGNVAAQLQERLEARGDVNGVVAVPVSAVAPVPTPAPAPPLPTIPTPAAAPPLPPVPTPAPAPHLPTVPTPAPPHMPPATLSAPVPIKADVKPKPPRRDSEGAVRTSATNVPAPPVAKAHPMPAIPPTRPHVPRPAIHIPAQPNPPNPPIQQQAPPHLRSNNNEAALDAGDEEARAERKRRQRQAQEEFRQRQLLKQSAGLDEKQELHKNSNSFDKLLLEIPSQDIVIEETGSTVVEWKRKCPVDGGIAKRRSVTNRLDIVQAD